MDIQIRTLILLFIIIGCKIQENTQMGINAHAGLFYYNNNNYYYLFFSPLLLLLKHNITTLNSSTYQ